MNVIKTDICVIGAGSGGLSVAAGAAQMGAQVVLIESGKMGGDCLNYGCVPSKALIAAAGRAAATAGGLGVEPGTPSVDFAAVKAHVAATIAAIAPHDSQERFEGLGVQVLRGHGAFTGPREVQVADTRVRARRFVIATGSLPMVPNIPGLEDIPYLTNETLFGLQEKPSHLLIIGAGPIGIEMAQAHARLGCRVTVLEADHALRHEDPEAAAIVLDRLRSEGVEIYEKVAVDSVSGGDEGVTVSLVGGRKIAGSHLLVAAGRKSNIEALGLDLAGIRSGQSIEVDRGLRTANRRVYAIGDVTGAPHFTHRAGYQAGLVVRSALFGLPAKERPEILPRVTFTEPELGQVGLTEAEASTKHGEALTVLRSDYSGNDRAQALGETNGFIKVMVVRGRPVGVTIVGHGAGEILSMWALAIGSGMKISTIATTVLPYPTLAEIGKRAAGTYFSERLFDSPWIKRAVRLVQKALP